MNSKKKNWFVNQGGVSLGVYHCRTLNVSANFVTNFTISEPFSRMNVVINGEIVSFQDSTSYGTFASFDFSGTVGQQKEFYLQEGVSILFFQTNMSPGINDVDFTKSPLLQVVNSRYCPATLFDFSNNSGSLYYIQLNNATADATVNFGAKVHPLVTALSLSGTKVFWQNLDELNDCLPNLTSLYVTNSYTVNQGVGNIQSLTQLTSLTLTGNTMNQVLDTFVNLTYIGVAVGNWIINNFANLPLVTRIIGDYIRFNGGTTSVNFSMSTVLYQIQYRRGYNYLLPEHCPPALTNFDTSQNSQMSAIQYGELWIKLDILGLSNGTWRHNTAFPETSVPPEYDAVKASLRAKGWNLWWG